MRVLLLLAMMRSGAAVVPHFQIGACYGYFNFLGPIDYAVKLAFDQGFFDDVLSTTSFTFDISSVDTQCSPTNAAQAGLPLFLGNGQQEGRMYSLTDVPPVIAINGCTCSSASKVIANQAVSYTTPMVSGSSTSPDLSNKDVYKFFARTIPPDSMQAIGLVKITTNFQWKRVFGIHMNGDGFGEGLVGAYCEYARAEGIDCLMRDIPYLLLDKDKLADFDAGWPRVLNETKAIASESPAPRIMMAVGITIDWMLYAFRAAGLATPKHVWLLSEGSCSASNLESTKSKLAEYQAISTNPLWADTAGWESIAESIEGMACLLPNPTGPRMSSAAFNSFWNGLTKAALVGAGYPVHADWTDDWLDRDKLVAPYWSLHFDAMTGILASIASMLSKGVAAADIKGEDLRKELFGITYEGLSGQISFNADGDRLAPYDVMNLQSTNAGGRRLSSAWTLKNVGTYDGSSGSLTFTTPFLFGGGATTAPLDQPAPCNAGSSYSRQADACQPCPKGTYESQAMCISCQQGTWTSSSGATQCLMLGDLCGSGSGEAFDVTLDSCIACPLGKVGYAQGCKVCSTGTYAEETGTTSCKSCLQGTYQASVGQSVCTNCSPGTYANLVQQSVCFNCSAGLYAGEAFENCVICAAGKYQDEMGQETCKSCGGVHPGTTSANGAQTSEDCFCKEGSYYRPGGSGCTTCTKGLACPAGRDIPTQKERFYAEIVDSATRDYDVYECATESWCPEGDLQTCSHPRGGRACARIENEKCKPWVLMAIPFCMFMLYCCYRVTANAQYGKVSAWVMLAGNLGIAISSMQAINVYLLLFEELPKELHFLLQVAEFFMFKWQGFMPECNVGQDFASRLSVTILPPLAIVGLSAVNWAITNALAKTPVTKTIPPMNYGSTWNCVGMLIQVMYIMQCKDAFSYFTSRPNPCDKETLQDYSDVVFGSDEHVSVGPVLITTYLWVFYVIGTYVVFTYTVFTAKAQVNNALFWSKWRFIFGRWRPACRHWGCLLLARNLIIALIPICIRTDQLYRVLAFTAVLGVHAIFEANYMPWLTNMNNIFEIGVSILLVGMGVVGLGFHESASESQKKAASFVMVFFMFLIWVSMLVSLGYALLWGSPKAVKARQARHSTLANELLEKSAGVLETLHGNADVKSRWNVFSKAITTYDKKSFEASLAVLQSFEQQDPLVRRMQSRISVTDRNEKSSDGSSKYDGETKTSDSAKTVEIKDEGQTDTTI